jgi:hypothetical protein
VTEQTYTRSEWEKIQRKEICDRQGHDYEIVVTVGRNAPEAIICRRCGLSWAVPCDLP